MTGQDPSGKRGCLWEGWRRLEVREALSDNSKSSERDLMGTVWVIGQNRVRIVNSGRLGEGSTGES